MQIKNDCGCSACRNKKVIIVCIKHQKHVQFIAGKLLRKLESFKTSFVKTRKMGKLKQSNSLTNQCIPSVVKDSLISDVKNGRVSKHIISSVKTRRMKKLEELNSTCLWSPATKQVTSNDARIEKGTDASRSRPVRSASIEPITMSVPMDVDSSNATKENRKMTLSSQITNSRRSKSVQSTRLAADRKAKRNKNIQQNFFKKIERTEQRIDTENSHSIFGSSKGHSVPVQQTQQTYAKGLEQPKEITTGLHLLCILKGCVPLPKMRGAESTIHANCDEVYPSLYVGDMASAISKTFLRQMGITHILNAAEGSKSGQVHTYHAYYEDMPKIRYIGFPLTDSRRTDISIYFYEASKFIENGIESGGKVLVHCAMGISRSTTCALAYLMINKKMSAVDAIRTVRMRRNVRPNDGFLQQLADLDNKLQRERQ